MSEQDKESKDKKKLQQMQHDLQAPIGAINVALETMDKNPDAAKSLLKNALERLVKLGRNKHL